MQNLFPAPADSKGMQRIAGSCSESDSIRLFTGDLVKTIQLVNVPTVGGFGLPLEFTMVHHSMEIIDSTLGPKWRHNYMMGLSFAGMPVNLVTFTDTGGQQYTFTWDGTAWVRGTTSYFIDATLTESGSNWLMTLPDGTQYTFNSGGQLIQILDPHTNPITLTYSGSLLVAVTEGTGGRSILLGYSGTQLTSVTDPNDNEWTLVYSVYAPYNLIQVVGPAGCVTTYDHTDATDPSVITQRTDANGHSYQYAYSSTQQLVSVTDAETPSHTIAYAYGSAQEFVSDLGDLYDFAQTTLTDARGKVWQYRFDGAGLLWRVLQPVNHWRHYFHDGNQNLLYQAAGYPFLVQQGTTIAASPRDNVNSTFQRFVSQVDPNTGVSDGTLQQHIDATGMVTQFGYDSQRHVTSVYPGQAHYGVQGNWADQFGADGFLLCAFNDDGTDNVQLPSYVSGVNQGASLNNRIDTSVQFVSLADPRALTAPDGLGRNVGFWSNTASFTATVSFNTAQSFNLSVYTCGTDVPPGNGTPVEYYEQFGSDLLFTVTDLNGTYTYRVTNNGVGAWITFPVSGDISNPVTVQVDPMGLNTSYTAISALMFDPYDSHRTQYAFNTVGDLLTITNALGQQQTMTYNSDGTRASYTDALSRQTFFYYEDAFKNLTRVVDADSNTSLFFYDNNGNPVGFQDANGGLWSTTYDAQNRPLTRTNPLNNTSTLDWDAVGNLLSIEDANGHTQQWTYTPTNRVATIVDALGDTTTVTRDETGNPLTITDARSNVTSIEYDDNGRPVSTTRPDTSIVQQAYDALDRTVAVTTPNGNQSTVTDINLVGAANFFFNPGAEIPGIASRPMGWVAPTRDTTVSHSGTASFKPNAAFHQTNVGLSAGARALLSFWTKTDGATTTTTSGTLQVTAVDASTVAYTAATVTVPSGTTTWQQSSLTRFDVPGDSQYAVYPCQQATFDYSPHTSHTWFDDLVLYQLSTGVKYDGQGRVTSVIFPNGTGFELVRDRWGRVVRLVDPRGFIATIEYDSLDRVIKTVDPLGDTNEWSWDAVGNLDTCTDAKGNVMTWGWDNLNRLASLTYPDTSQELFTHDAVGNLQTYTNCRGQERDFTFDAANQLTQILYLIDSTTVQYGLDAVGNVIMRSERNGDTTFIQYDAVNRPIVITRQPGVSAGTASWYQTNTFDAVGNRTLFQNGFAANAQYDVAVYNTAAFATPKTQWSVPTGGFDSMNRLTAYQDELTNTTGLAYDIEGRCNQVNYPNGATPPVSTMVYDLISRLLAMGTAEGATDLLPIGYSYDQANNRVTARVGGDIAYYTLDRANRLVQEDRNRFVDTLPIHFSQGTSNGIDFATGPLTLLPWQDSFQDASLDCDRWQLGYSGAGVGVELREQSDGLHVAFPRGYCNVPGFYDNNAINEPPTTGYALAGSVGLCVVVAQHQQQLSGDFDVQVDVLNCAGRPFGTNVTGLPQVSHGILVSANPGLPSAANWFTAGIPNQFGTFLGSEANYVSVVNSSSGPVGSNVATTDTAGQLRITRSGSTATGYYNDGSGWTSVYTLSSFSTADMYLSMAFVVGEGVGSGTFQDFQNNLVTNVTSGQFTSRVFDAGQSVTWSEVDFTAVTPSGTAVQFQIATSNSQAGPFTFVGPDGTSATYFTTSGTAVASGTTGRFCRYRASLSGTTSVAPTVARVDILFVGTNPSSSTSYGYDPAGNVIQKVTLTPDSGGTTVTETRDDPTWPSTDRINNLNQIMRNDITTVVTSPPSTVTVTWRYTWDLDGNMTSKSDGTNTTYFTWSDENRLTQVQLPSTVTVGYTYDVMGRTLTRRKSTDSVPTTFVWNGMDMVQETDPAGVVTRYNIPNGTLMSFVRGGVAYQCHRDALGSVRKVTDSTGAVVGTFDTDAWGVELPSTSDTIADGGMPYRFVGVRGVRWDATTGLYYIRARWYDPMLQRFVGRDIVSNSNRYTYARNNPAQYIDFTGLDAQQTAIQSAIDCIGHVPGYVKLASELSSLNNRGKIVVSDAEVDRAAARGHLDPHRVFSATYNWPSDLFTADIYLRPSYAAPDRCKKPYNFLRLLDALVHEGKNSEWKWADDLESAAASDQFFKDFQSFLQKQQQDLESGKSVTLCSGFSPDDLLKVLQDDFVPGGGAPAVDVLP